MKATYLQSLLTDPIIHRSFKGNSDTINSCLFNPNMYVKIMIL